MRHDTIVTVRLYPGTAGRIRLSGMPTCQTHRRQCRAGFTPP